MAMTITKQQIYRAMRARKLHALKIGQEDQRAKARAQAGYKYVIGGQWSPREAADMYIREYERLMHLTQPGIAWVPITHPVDLVLEA